MKINEIIAEDAGATAAGAIATVAVPLRKKPVKRIQEFGADNGPAPTNPAQKTPDQIKQDQTVKNNLNQLKSAGVDIDPNKGADDASNAPNIAGAVQKAMADPALASQIKSTLQKAQQAKG